ncbi:MAG: DUF6252 family protein [Bacteroidota bacterium]
MRHLKKLVLFVMVGAVISFSSCSDDDGDGGGPVTAGAGTLVATVDGAAFQSLDISSSATLASQGQFDNLIIIASSVDATAFAITVFGYDGPGTYEFDGSISTGVNVASYTVTDVDLNNPQNSTTEIWQAPYENLEVGSVTITEETDTNIKGSFEFMAKNVNGDQSIIEVTNGSFDLSKQTL